MKYKLNYEIESTQERIAEVNKILKENDEEIVEHFDKRLNPNPNKKQELSGKDRICRQLESLADYILYAEKKENYINTDSKKRTIRKHEGICLEEMIENDEDIIEDTRMFKKESITQDDIDKYPEIKKLHIEKEKVRKANKNWQTKDIITSLNYNMLQLKRSLSGQFNFHTSPSHPQYVFDNDTGYFKDDEYILVSENTIDFTNPKHISELIDNYGGLVDQSYEDCQSDIKHILYVLEELIDAAELPNYMFDILVWKIDGLTLQKISEIIQIKYGLVMTEKRISLIYRDIIPQKICETYKDQYEDWLYTYKVRGAWKKCSACGEIKLATEKNFTPDKTRKDGFFPYCKNCNK